MEKNPPNSQTSRIQLDPPTGISDMYRFVIDTPDADINHGAELAVLAFWKGMIKKAGIIVPTVSGNAAYPAWIHPYDNYWINRVSSYFFPRESTEWPIRLFGIYQSPIGEIQGGVYDIPEKEWAIDWEDAEGPQKWQPYVARPIADHIADMAKDPEKVRYGIYVRDHFFVLMAYDQWRLHGSWPFLIEIYGACRRALKYLEKYRDIDHNGFIETTCILSDLIVAGDKDIHSTERSEDQVILYGALKAFASMAHELGGKEDVAWAEAWAARIKPAISQVFWRPDGRFMFGVDRVTQQPKLEYMTTTFTNGYAILFGLTDADQTQAILDFMKRQEFVVPGPYHIPPVRPEDKPQNPPGVYCNGGCGWGRGIMPSVGLACYQNGRPDQGFDYLKRQAAAARQAGSFHEYWEWEKYTGKSKPGGAPWYGETSAGYLDVLLHGLFGIRSPSPGFHSIQVAPQFPTAWTHADLEMALPNDNRLGIHYRKDSSVTPSPQISFTIDASTLPIEIIIPWIDTMEPRISGTNITKIQTERRKSGWVGIAHFAGKGQMLLMK